MRMLRMTPDGFSVLPAVLVLLSLVWLARYTLTSAEVDETPTGVTA